MHVSPVPEEDLLTKCPYRHEPTLDAWVKLLQEDHAGLQLQGVGRTGAVMPTLLALGAQTDLIVLGLRGTGGFEGLAVGSVAHGVTERVGRPVVLVPSGPARTHSGRIPDGVTLGMDARDPVGVATDFAFRTAQRCKARLHVVHTWQLPSPAGQWMPFAPPEEDRAAWEDQEVQFLSDALRPWWEKYPDVRIRPDVILKTPPNALVQAASSADLLVMGRSGTTLGPTLHAVLEHTACPVAIVPSRS